MSRQRIDWRWSLIATGVLCGAGAVAYWNSFAVPFIFDDVSFIENNRTVHDCWPPTLVFQNANRPFVFWTFALNYAWHGCDPWGYHLVNLVVHVIAGMLLCGIVYRTLSQGSPAARYGPAAHAIALTVALIWMVHPLQTQAVTYIAQRMESLMGLFYLAVLYCFIRAQRSDVSYLWLAGSLVAALLGVWSKEVMATVPLVVLWYDRAFVARSWKEIAVSRRWYYAGLAATWLPLAWGMHRVSAGLSDAGVGTVKGVTPLDYLMSQAGVLTHYLRLCFWPTGQCIDYDWPVAKSFSQIVPPGLLILTLLGATVWCIFRHREWSFLGGWFFLILAPTSSVVPIRDLAFEHRMYLPSAAVVVVAVLGAYEMIGGVLWAAPSKAKKAAFGGLVVAIVLALGSATILRNRVYESQLSLWRDVVEKVPTSFRGYCGLGLSLANRGEFDMAFEAGRKAIALCPGSAGGYFTAGTALLQAGKPSESLPYLAKAVDILPSDKRGLKNLAYALLQTGKLEEAASCLDRARTIDPGDPDTLSALQILAECRRSEESRRAEYYERVRRDPDSAEAHLALGRSLRQTDATRAIAHFRQAVQLQPDSSEAHNNLGAMLTRLDPDLAASHFQRALQCDPENADAHNNYANLLTRQNRLAEAIKHYERALAIRPAFDLARRNLAIARQMQSQSEER